MDLSGIIGILGALVPIVAISGWIIIAVARTIARGRVRELEIRERIAMIEKGLVPPPETDPAGFDRAMNRYDRQARRGGSERHRRAGITLMGVGFGLMVLIWFAGREHGPAVGVGGMLVVMGLAFVINSYLESQRETVQGEPPLPPPAPTNSQPPQ